MGRQNKPWRRLGGGETHREGFILTDSTGRLRTPSVRLGDALARCDFHLWRFKCGRSSSHCSSVLVSLRTDSGPCPPGELLMPLSKLHSWSTDPIKSRTSAANQYVPQAQCLWLLGAAIDVGLFGPWHNCFLLRRYIAGVCTFRDFTVLLSKELGMD